MSEWAELRTIATPSTDRPCLYSPLDAAATVLSTGYPQETPSNVPEKFQALIDVYEQRMARNPPSAETIKGWPSHVQSEWWRFARLYARRKYLLGEKDNMCVLASNECVTLSHYRCCQTLRPRKCAYYRSPSPSSSCYRVSSTSSSRASSVSRSRAFLRSYFPIISFPSSPSDCGKIPATVFPSQDASQGSEGGEREPAGRRAPFCEAHFRRVGARSSKSPTSCYESETDRPLEGEHDCPKDDFPDTTQGLETGVL